MIAIQFSKITLSAYRTAVETVNQIEIKFLLNPEKTDAIRVSDFAD